jgi:hypothetical protein
MIPPIWFQNLITIIKFIAGLPMFCPAAFFIIGALIVWIVMNPLSWERRKKEVSE